MALPTIAASAFVDPRATVIGEVIVGENVYIGPGASVRADEGTPFFIGAESNLQDGVTLHGLPGKVILVQGRAYSVYVGRSVCLTHHALIHGPCYIGDRSFIGFKATVHDAVVGEGCVIGLGAVVIGVSLPPGRYVGHNIVVDDQEQADALPPVGVEWERLRDEAVEVNQELAVGHRQSSREPWSSPKSRPIRPRRRTDTPDARAALRFVRLQGPRGWRKVFGVAAFPRSFAGGHRCRACSGSATWRSSKTTTFSAAPGDCSGSGGSSCRS